MADLDLGVTVSVKSEEAAKKLSDLDKNLRSLSKNLSSSLKVEDTSFLALKKLRANLSGLAKQLESIGSKSRIVVEVEYQEKNRKALPSQGKATQLPPSQSTQAPSSTIDVAKIREVSRELVESEILVKNLGQTNAQYIEDTAYQIRELEKSNKGLVEALNGLSKAVKTSNAQQGLLALLRLILQFPEASKLLEKSVDQVIEKFLDLGKSIKIPLKDVKRAVELFEAFTGRDLFSDSVDRSISLGAALGLDTSQGVAILDKFGVLENAASSFFDTVKEGTAAAGGGMREVGREVAATTAVVAGAVVTFKKFGADIAGVFTSIGAKSVVLAGALTESLKVGGKVLLPAKANIFSFTEALLTASAASAILGTRLVTMDNHFARVAGSVSLFIAAVTGGLSLVIVKLVTLSGSLIENFGTKLVNAMLKATSSFQKFAKDNLIFQRTIQGFNDTFGESQGTIESWSSAVDSAVQSTTFTRGELQKSASELVAAGAQLGLQEPVLRKLFLAIQDYGTITGDVFQTTVDFVSGLQGASQGLLKYGVKLNETAIKQQAYKEGVTKSYESLTEQEKIQLRVNKIMALYPTIAGKAAAIAGSFAGQNDKLAQSYEELSIKMGEGSAVIENLAFLSTALNSALNTLPDVLFKVAGFITSLIGRGLQLIGVLLKLSFAFYGVATSIKFLNLALASRAFLELSKTSIPGLNVNLVTLIKNLGGTEQSLRSVQGLAKLLATSTLVLLKRSLISAAGAIKVLAINLLTLLANPVVLTVVAITTAIYALVKAFQFINRRTKVFSELWETLSNTLESSQPVFKPIIDFFGRIIDVVSKAARVVAGFFIDKLAASISFVVGLIKTNPFNIFSKEQVARFDLIGKKLDSFRSQLQGVGYDIGKLPEIKSIELALKSDKITNPEAIEKVIDRIRKAADKALAEAGEEVISARLAGASDEELEKLRETIFTRLSPTIQEARDRLLKLYSTTGDGKALEAAKSLGSELLGLKDNGKQAQAQITNIFQGVDSAAASSLTDFFTSLEDSTKSADEAFKDFSKNFIKRVQQMVLEALILQQIQSAFGSGVAPIPSATGGYISGGQVTKRFASGGYVSGEGSGTSDSIPARLSNGEFVSDAKTTAFFGKGFFADLKKIARRGFSIRPQYLGASKFADGGLVGGLGSDFFEKPKGTMGRSETKFEIVNTGTDKQITKVEEVESAKGTVVQIILEDINKNGPATRALSATYNLKRGNR